MATSTSLTGAESGTSAPPKPTQSLQPFHSISHPVRATIHSDSEGHVTIDDGRQITVLSASLQEKDLIDNQGRLLKGFMSALDNPDAITAALVRSMSHRMTSIYDFKFVYALANIYRVGAPQDLEELCKTVYDGFEIVAKEHIVSPQALAGFKTLLDSAEKNRLITRTERHFLDSLAVTNQVFSEPRFLALKSQVSAIREQVIANMESIQLLAKGIVAVEKSSRERDDALSASLIQLDETTRRQHRLLAYSMQQFASQTRNSIQALSSNIQLVQSNVQNLARQTQQGFRQMSQAIQQVEASSVQRDKQLAQGIQAVETNARKNIQQVAEGLRDLTNQTQENFELVAKGVGGLAQETRQNIQALATGLDGLAQETRQNTQMLANGLQALTEETRTNTKTLAKGINNLAADCHQKFQSLTTHINDLKDALEAKFERQRKVNTAAAFIPIFGGAIAEAGADFLEKVYDITSFSEFGGFVLGVKPEQIETFMDQVTSDERLLNLAKKETPEEFKEAFEANLKQSGLQFSSMFIKHGVIKPNELLKVWAESEIALKTPQFALGEGALQFTAQAPAISLGEGQPVAGKVSLGSTAADRLAADMSRVDLSMPQLASLGAGLSSLDENKLNAISTTDPNIKVEEPEKVPSVQIPSNFQVGEEGLIPPGRKRHPSISETSEASSVDDNNSDDDDFSLHEGIEAGDSLEDIRKILSFDIDVNKRRAGVRAIELAADLGREDIVNMLLKEYKAKGKVRELMKRIEAKKKK